MKSPRKGAYETLKEGDLNKTLKGRGFLNLKWGGGGY